MTTTALQKALTVGFERLTAWSDLLDEINVFPVADGDTGRNLVISLTPLRTSLATDPPARMVEKLLLSARGNSGNIAGRFFAEAAGTRPDTLAAAVRAGSQAARTAIRDPQEGTMLTLYDALADHLMQTSFRPDESGVATLLEALREVVRTTRDQQPRLMAAGVVDSGALGMYLFFETFFWSLVGRLQRCSNPVRDFGDLIVLKPDFQAPSNGGYCVDMILKPREAFEDALSDITRSETDVVATPHGNLVKVHFHTRSGSAARRKMASIGKILRWEEDNLDDQVRAFQRPATTTRIHIVTDAAASLTRLDQKRLNLTLLDSYITAGETSLPETRFDADTIYAQMQAGVPVSTAQASDYERHQFYQRLLDRHAQVLYLCVGSAFTGNHAAAAAWKAANDHDNRFTLIDTGAASGRLAVLVAATARLVNSGASIEQVVAFANASLAICREYIFVDRLKYLAAGGRLSRPSAFWGDILRFKPVVSPLATGVEKVGMVRSQEDQIRFAVKRLTAEGLQAEAPLIWLQYSDNRAWVESQAAPAILDCLPQAELVLQPLSLTTGVHTGPGTWAVALHPAPAAVPRSAAQTLSRTGQGRTPQRSSTRRCQ